MGDESPKPSPLERDIESARRWMWAIGVELNERADKHNEVSERLLDKVCVIACCMQLPGDGPLRVRLFPNVFDLKC